LSSFWFSVLVLYLHVYFDGFFQGHRLKNSKCLLLRELKRLPMDNKLLLTGTPLQNNLAELWSLLNFILPDIFSSHQEFESWYYSFC
ncbi:Os09g0442700, partial [Oryza sativa Japonica Group]